MGANSRGQLSQHRIISTDDLGLIRVAPRAPNVLVVSEDGQVRRNVARALVSIGCGVHPLEAQANDFALLDREFDLYVLDADVVSVREFIPRIRESFPHMPILMLAHDALSTDSFELLMESGVSNLVARHGQEEKRRLVDESELITTCHKLLTGDVFGIEKYFSSWGARVVTETVLSTRDKNAVLENINQFLEALYVQTRIQERICVVADELITNAMFAAPRDALGRRKYAERDRNGLELEPSERVDVSYACDGRNFVIGVLDRFGSLQRTQIVDYVRDQLGRVPRQIRSDSEGPGGGVGLHMVLDSVTQLVFNIQPQIKTEVIGTFYVRSGHKTMRNTGKSLNVFFKV